MTQKEALEILKMGYNVFITGPAGSGKTHLLNNYIKFLKDNEVEVGITASTGIAATHMGGTTIHSWTGMGINDRLTRTELDELMSRKYLRDRFERTKVLIIDEVSMLHHFRLDLIDEICRNMKKTDLPFGGMQVVLCGDFFQLPPISRFGEPAARFSYEAEIWKNAGIKICYLEEQHRQTDKNFLKILNEIRANNLSEDSLQHLQDRQNKSPSGNIEPTKLHTHNVDVDEINERELQKLAGQGREYSMSHKGRKPLVESLKKSCLAPDNLKLKVGAKVMFVKNSFDGGYANGTLGKVSAFDGDGPIVTTMNGKVIHVQTTTWKIEEDGNVKALIEQFPLRLAWAITVHKSQGMSLDAIEVDLSKSFEKGMGYVALSRVRSLDGLKLLGLNAIATQVREDVLEYDEKLQKISNKNLMEMEDMTKIEIAEAQKEFLERIVPPKDEKTGKVKKIKVSTYEETRKYLEAGMNINEIAQAKGVQANTILDHLEKILDEDRSLDISVLQSEINISKFKRIYKAWTDSYGDNRELRLSPVMEILGGPTSGYSFEDLRIVRLFIKKKGL